MRRRNAPQTEQHSGLEAQRAPHADETGDTWVDQARSRRFRGPLRTQSHVASKSKPGVFLSVSSHLEKATEKRWNRGELCCLRWWCMRARCIAPAIVKTTQSAYRARKKLGIRNHLRQGGGRSVCVRDVPWQTRLQWQPMQSCAVGTVWVRQAVRDQS